MERAGLEAEIKKLIVETLMLNSMDSFFTEGFAAIAEEQD